ncbi:MAG: helix-turn-helix transcriptional regulator [Firmicutes bacterium]|nr:helix-turn-helix transcriptional regulator [Bacillota bacterium]
MATIQIHVERLRTMMKERGWTERELAQAMDISIPYLNRLLNGQRGLGAHALAGLRLAGIAWDAVVEIVPSTAGDDATE